MDKRKVDLELGNIKKEELDFNFEHYYANRVLKMVEAQVSNKSLIKNKISIRYENLIDEPDSQLKLISKQFSIQPNFDKVKRILTRKSYSSTKNKYNIEKLSDEKAIKIIGKACELWKYDFENNNKA